MFLALLLIFVVLPIAELYVVVQVGSHIGVLATFGLMVLFTVAGVWLCKREGLGVLRRMNAQLNRGRGAHHRAHRRRARPAAGALLIVPGFITDVIGLVLLVPPVRALLRATVLRRLQRRIDQASPRVPAGAGFGFVRMGGGYAYDDYGEVVDAESYEVRRRPGRTVPRLEGPR